MMADGRLQVASLISAHYPVNQATEAYKHLLDDPSTLALLLDYPHDNDQIDTEARHIDLLTVTAPSVESPRVSFIGTGNYAGRILIPAFAKTGVTFSRLAATGGIAGTHYGRKYGFQRVTTDISDVIGETGTDIVVIATRHDSHASFAAQALEAHQAVFVEKPLAMDMDELDMIESVYRQHISSGASPVLMVGFNRRFAPLVVKLKQLLATAEMPKVFVYTVNAGPVAHDSWVHDPIVGGGRILGEACHFIDLLRFVADAEIVDFCSQSIRPTGAKIPTEDASITVAFSDGSVGTIHYIARGGKKFPKERLEVFCDDAVLQLNNFRSLIGFGWPGFQRAKPLRMDKGHVACATAFVEAIRLGESAPIPFEELLEVSRVSIEISDKLSKYGSR
jgi:predicted dehydrogenase